MFKFIKLSLSSLLLTMVFITPSQATIVDLELSLVIDVSGSVSTSEYNLQLDGYAAGFRDSGVIQNIVGSTDGIAVNAVFFGTSAISTALDAFTILTTEAESLAFADVLGAFVRPGGGSTNIVAGLSTATDLLLSNGLDATFGTIIDVSGDGEENVNSDADVNTERDRAVSEGFTVNGIAIGSQSLETYYVDNIIGGDNSFALLATSFTDFEAGIIEKLRIETVIDTGVTEASAPSVFGMMLIGLGLLGRRKMFKN